MNRIFLRSDLDDPFGHLAIEEQLLEERDDDLLFVYRNRPCVVIGKHQNPWLECDLEAMAADGVPLVRRFSGGGAVYHDEGNLNFAFVGARADYDQRGNFSLLRAVLAELGVDAELRGNSLFAGRSKISGNAFCYRRDRVLHHGTLLLRTDLDALRRCLSPRAVELETHAIRSEPALVANLDLDLDDLVAGFRRTCAAEIEAPAPDEGRVETFRANDWVYGKTPRFRVGGVEHCGEAVAGGRLPD